jgi:hypothetical protein
MNEIVIVLQEKIPSLNEFYAGKHHFVRKKIKDKFKEIFKKLLEPYSDTKIDTYRVKLTYSSRLDADNAIMAVKFLNDALQEAGITETDSPKCFKGFSVKHEPCLPKNTYNMRIIYEEEG